MATVFPETATAENPANRDDSALDLSKLYSRMAEERDSYEDRAHEIARLTAPWLAPRGEEIEETPYSSLGTLAVRSLSSTLHRLLMPPTVQWYRFNIADEVRAAAEGGVVQGLSVEMLDAMLAYAEQRVTNWFDQTTTRSRFSQAIFRNLIEGNTLFNTVGTQLRVFPLRSFVVRRWSGTGQPRVVVIRERESKADLIEDINDESKQESHREDDQDTGPALYTLVDYELGEVWQQQHGQDRPEQVSAKTGQYFILVPYIPDVGNYAVGYAWEYMGLISEINLMAESMGELAAAAALNIPMVRADGPSPKTLEGFKRGQWLVADPEMLSAFNMGVDMSKASVVVQRIVQLREELAQVFAMGIKDRAIKAETATAILEIISELETQTQDLMTAYEETGQRPLVNSVLITLGLDQLDSDRRAFKTEITTGVNALQREAGLMRYIAIATQVMQLDPTLVLDGLKVMKIAGDAVLIPTEGLVRKLGPEEIAAAQQTLNQVSSRQPRRETILTPGGPQPPQPNAGGGMVPRLAS